MKIKNGRAEILLIGNIGSIFGRVTAEGFIGELKEAETAAPDIDIHLHTKGGDVPDGIAIFNAIKSSTARITIYIDGYAASMGAVIALAGSKVKMSRYARIMTHCVSGVAAGGAADLRRMADLMDSLNGTFAQMIAERTGLSEQQAQAKYLKPGVDTYLTADQALAAGLIDEIYDGPITEDILTDSNINNPETAARLDAKICAVLAGTNNVQNMDSKIVAQALGLGEKASDADIQAALEANKNEAARAKAETAQVRAEKEKLETTLREKEKAEQEAQKERINAFLDQVKAAQKEGRITAELSADLQAIADTALEHAQSILAHAAPRKPITGQLETGKPGNPYEGKTWAELDRDGRLEAYKKDNPEGFKSLYLATFNTEYKG